MGKSIRKKIARFELEPGGFSIHTFELSCQIKGKRYHEIKSYLFTLNATKGETVTFRESDSIKRKHRRSICFPAEYRDTAAMIVGPGTTQVKEALFHMRNALVWLVNSTRPAEYETDNLKVADMGLLNPTAASRIADDAHFARAVLRWWWEAQDVDEAALRIQVEDTFYPCPTIEQALCRIEDPDEFLPLMRGIVANNSTAIVNRGDRFLKKEKKFGALRVIGDQAYLVMPEKTWAAAYRKAAKAEGLDTSFCDTGGWERELQRTLDKAGRIKATGTNPRQRSDRRRAGWIWQEHADPRHAAGLSDTVSRGPFLPRGAGRCSAGATED